LQKAGLLLCAIVFAFAPAGQAAADTNGRIVAVERMNERGEPRWALAVPEDVIAAIEGAAVATGADFDFLLKTAALESSFDPDLTVKTSSAVGLYQFVERTWFLMIHAYGAEAGLDTLAASVVFTQKGECLVDDELTKDEILALRNDVELAAYMAAILARQNANAMAKALGRAPDPVELYIGHLMGAAGGSQLIKLAESKPKVRADKEFRRAARANRTIFFDGKKPRSYREVRDLIAAKYVQLEVRRALPAAQVAELAAPARLAGE
jgi:hypothetical protein